MEDITKQDALREDFDSRVKKFNKDYLYLIISAGAVIAAAIVLAVYVHVMVGLALAFGGALLYTVSLRDGLRKYLGLSYRRVEGGIACALLMPCGKKKGYQTECEERYVPARLMWLDVTELCGREKKQRADGTVKVLHLPASIKKIDGDALLGMTALEKIVYDGDETEWAEVECLAELSEIEIQCKIANEEINEIL